MIRRFSYKNHLVLLLTLPLILAACSGEQKPADGTPEALLVAEGQWPLVEERQAQSPQQKHMNSRKQVSPSQTEGHNGYTQTVEESAAHEDVHFRVLRLERQMSALQGDFDKILPPLSDRAKADQALGRAVDDIQGARKAQTLSEPQRTAKPQAAATTAPSPAAEKPKTASPQPQKAKPGALAVSSLRVGDHPGKTRIVLDLTGPGKFSADLDGAENILLIELPGAQWLAAAQKSFGAHPLLQSYSVQSSGDSTRLVVALKKAAKLGTQESLSPNATYNNHRIVIDLLAQ
jgi:hypothetical protein